MGAFSRLIILCSFCLQSSVMYAVQKDSISIVQFVRDSFTRYGVRNALVTVMDSTGNVIDTTRTVQVREATMGKSGLFLFHVKRTSFE